MICKYTTVFFFTQAHKMTIVTLTSDFGLQDNYAAKLKGALLRHCVHLNIIDVTHNIKNYDIVQSAYVVRNMYESFPENTIHIVSVNNFYSPEAAYVLVSHQGHYFLGPDNGVFSLIFSEQPKILYKLESKDEAGNLFKLDDIYARAVAHIANENPIEDIGEPLASLTERISLQAIIGPTQIRGSVIHIDNFENVILNITRELWERYSYYRHFALFFKRHDAITTLSTCYSDVPIGETLCQFNSADHLEIAINMGKAATMHNLTIDDTVQLDFY